MKSKIQTLILSIIAVGIISLVIQNQIIINKLSNQTSANNFAKNVNYKPNQNFALVPVNPDGSINVNIKSANDIINVNIEEVGGFATFGKIPVEIED